MKPIVIFFALGTAVACSPSVSSKSNHQNLNVAECRALAAETRKSGRLNYNLCPGYSPDGFKIELF